MNDLPKVINKKSIPMLFSLSLFTFIDPQKIT
jgi:hypothetical protein